jgi:hypothetical protein
MYRTPQPFSVYGPTKKELTPQELLDKLEDDYYNYRQDANAGYFEPKQEEIAKFQKDISEARKALRDIKKNPMKKKTRKKKVVRRKRRSRKSMAEKRVMQIKRGLMKSAKKLRLGAKRTGAYVYGTLRRIVGNPGKARFGYAKIGMELLGTGLKIAKGERVYMTPATNIPGGGFFVRPAYPTGLWKEGSEDNSIYIRPSEVKTDITYKKPVFGSKSFERMIRGNPMRSFASLHPSDRVKLNRFSDYVNSFYGKGGVYARDFKNGGFDRKTIERAIMVYIDDVRKGKVEWGDGDSIDRERVRMILEPGYSMFIPEGKVTIRKNPGEQRYTVDADRRKNYSLAEARRIAEERTRRFGMRGINRSSSIFPYKKPVRANSPMYAHGMTAHRTHGLSLKQMMKLYRLVSSGNPKAVMFARRTLGIPMSESLSQVKAVVYHHVMDLRGKI